MKKILTALGMVSILGSVAWAANPDDILYVGRIAGSGVSNDEASTVETSICTAATQDKRFHVKCRDVTRSLMDLRQAQAELGFPAGEKYVDDCGTEGCLGKLAKAVQAKWMVSGSLAKVADRQFLLTLVVADPNSGQQLNRVEEKVSGELSAVIDRIPEAVRRVLTPQQAAKKPAPAPAKK